MSLPERFAQFDRLYHPCALTSTWRAELSKPENVRRSYDLRAMTRKAGFGLTWLDGHWSDAREETCVFIVADVKDDDRLLDFLRAVAKQFDQPSFIHKGNSSRVREHDRYGNVLATFAPFDQATAEIAWGRRGSRAAFRFVATREPLNFFARMALDNNDPWLLNECV